MQKQTKILITAAIIIILIKSLLSLLVNVPTIYTDEYIYIKMTQSFYQNLNFNIHNMPTSNYPPLYPLLLSLTFIFNSIPISYILMKILNAILSTLIIIPSYLLAKEFLNKKEALISALIITILPMNFSFAPYIMSENLFYTLFMFSLYFIYKSFTEKSLKYDILSGILIGLSFLTKFAALSLVFIVLALFVYKLFKKEYYELNKKIVMGIIAFIIVCPWLIRNIVIFGPTLSGLLGQHSTELSAPINNYLLSFIIWVLLYFDYLLIAGLIFLPIIAFTNLKEKFKNNKLKIFTILTIITLIFIVLGTVHHAAKSTIKETTLIDSLNGRPIGRYIETALPILILLGLISYYKYKNYNPPKTLFIIAIIISLSSLELFYFQLLPVNNISLTGFGIAKIILSELIAKIPALIILTAILILATVIICKQLQKKKIKSIKVMPAIAIVFILIGLMSFSISIYSSHTWDKNPQINLSKWISSNIENNASVIVDEDSCGIFNKSSKNILCTSGKSMALTDLWVLNPTFIGNLNNKSDYIITLKKLDLNLIKTENDIYLYKTN